VSDVSPIPSADAPSGDLPAQLAPDDEVIEGALPVVAPAADPTQPPPAPPVIETPPAAPAAAVPASPPPPSAGAPAPSPSSGGGSLVGDRPELAVGGAFAGGLVLALILKRLAR
jgi:hypothetical protein